MDDKKKKKKKKSGEPTVPLPSASETEQTVLEKQNLVKQIHQVVSDDIKTATDSQSVHSESDNEIVQGENLNLDDEFEKIVPSKIDDLEEIAVTDEDLEIVEILDGGAKSNIDDAIRTNINITSAATEVVEKEEKEKKIESDTLENIKIDREEEKVAEISAEKSTEELTNEKSSDLGEENIEIVNKPDELESSENKIKSEEIEFIKNLQDPVEPEKLLEVDAEIKTNNHTVPHDVIDNPTFHEEISKVNEKSKETIIDEDLLPRETILKIVAEFSAEHSKPAIPLQTYLWEDVKRAKEQGGYPWTHLYKQPLEADEEPEVILTYNRSPKFGRRAESTETTPRSQKKVRIHETVEVQEATNQSQNTSISDNTDEKENIEIKEEEEEEEQTAVEVVKKSPKSILKRSQKILENIKPSTSRFDSDSLKRKIKSPLTRIKNMADQQFKKVKSSATKKPKKIPVSKEKILLNEEVKILKLKESPKSQHREVATYIVKQDSDETLDIVELDQSPSEARKVRREVESGILTPDEIINLPVSTSDNDKNETTDSCKNEEVKREETPIRLKKVEHHYEDIDDYIAGIASDSENVDRVSDKNETKLVRQTHIIDPIFDEFSRDFNKQIRKSLSAQDDSIRQELMRRVPKIEEIEKQISDEDREEKIENVEVTAKSLHLLAPISSIDSTSSDEDRARLSMVAEESENSDSKKKSFEHEPSLDILDIESLKVDDSDVETLIEDIRDEFVVIEKILVKEEKLPVRDDNKIENLNDLKITYDQEKQEEEEVIPYKIEGKLDTNLTQSSETLKESQLDVSKESPSDETVNETIKENLEAPPGVKISAKWSKMSDHEYEPIGEPQSQMNENEVAMFEAEGAQNKRSFEDSLGGGGNEKKLLRTPTEDSEDNISAQDFQDQIENRFFRQEIEPISNNEESPHPEITREEAVIIDEEPIVREIPKPKKKGFMESAQMSGITFHKKIKAQASSIKSSINNKMKKKPKEKPVACEISEIGDETPDEEKENFESIKINVQDVDEEAAKATKQSKMSKLKMNIKKPSMPKFKKPQFKPDFSSLRRLGRSKSMKDEPLAEATAGESSSLHSPEAVTADPTPRKKFDFGTYPRMIRDKFKRSKLPERSDRSLISDSPAADEDFNRISSTFTQRGPVASRWPEYATEEESGKYQHFDSETDLERERIEFEESRHGLTEEQRQLVDMDRENLQIHLMAKHDKFRKPFVERQESDVASEDVMWSGMLNKNAKPDDDEEEEFEENVHRFKYELDSYPNEEIMRSSTPKSNQETQSSGSSGTRRRRGYLDDEDDEYFIRDQKSNVSSGYIDSAIKEGLGSPDENALAQMDSIDREFSPDKPTRSLKRKKKQAELPQEEENQNFDDYFKAYPPHRPMRKQKSLSVEPNDEEMIMQIPDDASDIIDEQGMTTTFKGIEHPDLAYLQDDYDNDMDYNISNMPVPPTPPRRRKKKIRSMLQHQHVLSNAKNDKQMQKDDIIVYRQELKFVPLAQEEHFTTPTPTPRRTRSRSQISSYTLDDADSFIKDSIEGFTIVNISENNKENNKDYATVRKENPSRPIRRKRSTKSLGERQFATLPLLPKRSDHDVRIPPRPPRNYSTISSTLPNKPPRRKSVSSLVEISKTIKDDDYEEILDVNDRLSQRLQSGAVVNKMKDRPLPPPPRPKREHRKPKKDSPDDVDDKPDRDEDAERIILEAPSIDVVDNNEPALVEEVQQRLKKNEDDQQKFNENRLEADAEIQKVLPHQDSEFSEPERPIEVDMSTQTDPIFDEEYALEDEEGSLEEYLSSNGKIKTLEDILKEEQEAELERARQLAEAENLSRGIQRFRESSQRSFSERSGRSKSLSRPITPSAVVVEMRKSSPIVFERQEQMMTEAGLFIHPITYDDYGIQHEDEEVMVITTEPEESLDVNNNLSAVEQEHPVLEEVTIGASPEPDVAEILRRAQEFVVDTGDDEEELDAEMQRKIEEMIESVMSSAKEEVDWIRNSSENVVNDDLKEIEINHEIQKPLNQAQVQDFEEAPLPPPRKKLIAEEPDEVDIVLEEEDEPSIKIDTREATEESQAISEERPSSPFPSRLHLTSLEIDNLSVTQLLTAGRITTSEFECKLSSSLPSNSGTTIEIPQGLIEEIVERVRSAERAQQQQQQKIENMEEPPSRPPLPAQYQYDDQQTSPVPPSFFQLRNYSEDEQPHLPAPHRRRKHHQKQKKESTSEDDYQRPRSRTGGNDRSVLGLGSQFLRACGNSMIESGNQIMEILRAASKDEQSRDLHIALIILIIIVAGLFLMGMSDKAIHHHHWDFFNYPDPGEKR